MTRLKKINEDFFELYGRIYSNKQFLTIKQYKEMTNCLFGQYSVEFQKFYLEKKIEDKYKIFVLKRNGKYRIPFKFLLFKNKLAKLIVKNIKAEVKQYFDTFEKKEQPVVVVN